MYHIGPGFGFRAREEEGENIAGVTSAYIAPVTGSKTLLS